jgi:Tfp pilus assembly protein PilO
MNRQSTMLAAVGSVLVLALFWMFLLSPKREELAQAQEAILTSQAEQRSLTNQINTLREVRATAPQVEARLAATEALIPSGPALPSTLRQLQLAADEAGMVLSAVSPGQPGEVVIEGLPPGASSMSLSVTLSGSYFQIVDFLRRVEDPMITPRAIIWSSMSISPEDYPTLGLTLSGMMFVLDRGAVAAGGA